jgi:hypothetical protein
LLKFLKINAVFDNYQKKNPVGIDEIRKKPGGHHFPEDLAHHPRPKGLPRQAKPPS